MVEGTINGFPFRASLEPNGKGSHCLTVNEAMRDAAWYQVAKEDAIVTNLQEQQYDPKPQQPGAARGVRSRAVRSVSRHMLVDSHS